MPEKKTIRRARKDVRAGKAPTTQAGEFVREEIHHIRKGKHGARSPQQAIAIGLSKARRAGVKLPPRPGRKSQKTRRRRPSARQSAARLNVLRRERRGAASRQALSRHARSVAARRRYANRSSAARKAAATRRRTQGRSGSNR